MQILKEKFKNKKEIRKEEIELKKKEQENKAAQHQMLKDLQFKIYPELHAIVITLGNLTKLQQTFKGPSGI